MTKKQELKPRSPHAGCAVCKTTRPNPVGPLPFEWHVHLVNDADYLDGYYTVVTCSEWCRAQGGWPDDRHYYGRQ